MTAGRRRLPVARLDRRAPPRESVGAPTTLPARCARSRRRRSSWPSARAADRRLLLPSLVGLGLPAVWRSSAATTAFVVLLRRRAADAWSIEAIADPWTPEEATSALGAARWVHVAPLTRGDFPPETLAALARRPPRSRSTVRGSSGPPEPGRSSSTPTTTRTLLRSVSILKLSEEEAELLVDGYTERALAPAGRARGRRHARLPRVRRLRRRDRRARARAAASRAPIRPAPATRSPPPTWSPAAAATAPTAAARRASALVAGLLSGGRAMIAHVQTAAGLAVVDLDEEIGARARRRRDARAAAGARRCRCRASSPRPPRARRSSPSSTRSRRSSSRTTRAARGASRAAGCRPAARSRSRPTTRTSSSTRRATASTSRGTAAASGAASRSSCPRSRRSVALELELAAGDDHGRAADLDAVDPVGAPSTRAYSFEGRPISTPWVISISSPKAIRPWRARWTASGPAADPVAGSSATPPPGANIRVFQRRPGPARQLKPSTSGSVGERPRSGFSAGHLLLASRARRTRSGGRCRRPRPAARSARRRAPPSRRASSSNGATRRNRLLHPAEDDPRAFALEPHGDDAGAGLEPDLAELERAGEHEGGAERRVPGERHLDPRREDPDPRVRPVGRRRVDEDRLARSSSPARAAGARPPAARARR